MSKRLNYTIGINADTTQFKSNINEAIATLQKLGIQSQVNTSLQQASKSALDLSTNLARALNPETGKIDLLTFNKNLKQSGETLQSYYNSISQLGPSGREAFAQIATSIVRAEIPLKRSSKLMDQLWVTMKNTMRWRLTTNALDAFVGTIENAYGYAKSLNSSLNSIRIVTQKSTDDMRKFAQEANNAAKALSTTTVDYTDASLIYYQQGLDDEQVTQRTDATIKLANVSRQSAEEVSSQMTAIWQNFYDGSKSLEYYGDVITALGAATASSSDQIAQGIQKFAPVANTVGLSYEYATTALATLVANTQQSADMVGTSLRTLFSRLESLKLGETLDDDTDLNKYSQALLTVGVNIKDVNGELKDMDQILDETAAKWGQLSRDQQMALAQTVGGVRQYTSFVALMDNWNDFQRNLSIAVSSEGSLQKQADIYAESWEAARKRVKASAEDIYDSLINEDFFIGFDNNVSIVLDRTADIVDGMGGMGGAITTLGSVFFNVFQEKLINSLINLSDNFSIFTKGAIKEAHEIQNAALEGYKIAVESTSGRNLLNQSSASYLANELQFGNDLVAVLEKVPEHIKKQIEPLKISADLLRQSVEYAQQLARESESNLNTTINDYRDRVYVGNRQVRGFLANIQSDPQAEKDRIQQLRGIWGNFSSLGIQKPSSGNAGDKLTSLYDPLVDSAKSLTTYQKQLMSLQTEYNKGLRGSVEEQKKYAQSIGMTEEQINKVIVAGKTNNNITQELADTTGRLTTVQTLLKDVYGFSDKEINVLLSSMRRLAQDTINVGIAGEQASHGLELLLEKAKELSNQPVSWQEMIVGSAQLLFSIGAINSAIDGLVNTLSDENKTGIEKFTSGLTSLSSVLMQLMILSRSVMVQQAAGNTVMIASAAASGFAAAGFTGMAASVKALDLSIKSLLGPIALAIGALTIIINVISKFVEKERERQQALRDSAYEQVKNNQELIDSNNELIKSMSTALDSYKTNGDNKEDLDNKTRALAEAYNLEGAAIASVTGKYEDYNVVLKQAAKEREKQLKEQLKNTKSAMAAAEDELWDAARKGKGYKYGSGYNVGFGGWQGFGAEETTARDIFEKNVSSSVGYMGAKGVGAEASININSPTELVKLYDDISAARLEMQQTMTNIELQNSGIYQEIVEWLDKMSESVERYRQYADEVLVIQQQLNDEGNLTLKDSEISNYEEYKTWITEVTKSLKDMGKEQKDIDEIIKTLISESTNPLISQFSQLYDVLTDIQNITGKDLFDKLKLDKKINADNIDIFSNINWELVTDEQSFNTLYANSEKYLNAAKNVEEAQSLISGIDNAQSIIKKAKGDIGVDELTKLSHAIDWGQNGNVKFEEFLKMTQADQSQYLTQMETDAYQNIQDSSQVKIDAIKEDINGLTEYLNNVDQNRLKEAEETINKQEAIWDAYLQYQKDKATGQQQDDSYYQKQFGLDESQLATFSVAKDMLKDEVRETIEKGMTDAKATVDVVSGIEEQLEVKKKELESESNTFIINARVNFDNQLSNIESSTDGIVSIFEAIEKGVEKTTNEAGKTVYGFSLEAAQAIEEIYPGFMSNAQLLRDGTFALTEDMYKIFFDAAQGELSLDAQVKGGKLQNLIEELTAKKENAQKSLELAQKLADGSLKIEELSDEQKEQLYTDFVNGKKNANGELVKDEVEQLKQSDENNSTLWDNISNYSKQGAENMATNVSNSTGLILQNLEKIRDAAYKACLQYAQIGTENPQLVDSIDTVPKTVTNNIEWRNKISVGDTDSFFKTLEDQAKVDREDLFKSTDISADQAAGQRLVEYYTDYINGLDAQIAAAKTAQSKMLSAIDSAYDKVGKASKQNKTKDKEEAERYHYINRQLEKQEDLLSEIDKQIERTYGKERLDLYTEKQDELNNKIDLYNEKLKEANGYLEYDKSELLKAFGPGGLMSSTGLSLEFSEDGKHIANFRQITEYLVNQYNAIKDGDNEVAQAAKQRYSEMLKLITKYEETIDVIDELNELTKEANREIKDLNLDTISHKLEIRLDAKKLRDDLRNFQKEYAESIGDALTHNLNTGNIAKHQFNDDISILPALIENYNELSEAMKNASSEDDKNRIIQDMSTLQGRFIELGEQVLDYVDIMENLLPDAIDAARERFDKFTDQLSHNITVLDTVKELMTLQGVTYKDKAGYNQLQKILNERMEAQAITAKLNREWYENSKAMLEDAERALIGVSEDDINYDRLRNERDALLAENNQALEAMLSSAKEAMDTAEEMFTQSVERASYEFSDIMSNGIGLDQMQDNYDHYIEEEERYFDKVNELYQVNKWNNKLQADIDKSTNKAYQQQLKALQDKIDLRKENNKLSEYDMDILEAEYKMLLAQMALEDAQNAKTNLRLVKDSQGNWNYQYTANQDNINAAQNALLDAQNEYYNIAKKQVGNTTSEIVKLYAEANDAVKEVWNDMTLTDKERTAKLEEIERYYIEKIKYLEEEKNIAIKDMTAAGLEVIDDFENNYAATLDDMDGEGYKFKENLDDYMQKCEDNFNDFKVTVDQVAEETGTALGDPTSGLTKIINDTSDATKKLGEQGSKAIDDMYDKLEKIQDLTTEFGNLATQVRDAISAVNEYAGLTTRDTNLAQGYVDEYTDYSVLIAEAMTRGATQEQIDKLYELRAQKMAQSPDQYGKYLSNEDLKQYYQSGGSASPYLGYYDEEELKRLLALAGIVISKFDTGGYTGSFDNAKLAFLHEKELVLNQEDTKNILSAVSAVRILGTQFFRDIESTLDNSIIASMGDLNQRFNSVSGIAPIRDSVEQQVHIEASFPNAVDHNEIEEAFRNLTNDAAQWIHRRQE